MLLSTALAAIVAMPGTAHAQLVTSGDLVNAIDSGGNPGQLTVVDTSATRTDMTVLAPTVIANWNRFNVPVGTTVNVANGTANPRATLVNRVIGPNVSDIGGSINAADVNFWLINQNGILFGANTSINAASFFASTLDVTDQDLFDFYEGSDLAGNGPGTLNFGSSLGNSISGGGLNASFVTDGTMMFVSEQLNLDATFDAQTGGVAFVTAADANVTFTPGSPLSFVLNAGTTVAEGQTIAGSVKGSSIDFQMLTAAGVVNALLKVDATLNATAAAATDTGIRLFARQDGMASVTVEMTGGISSTGLINLDTDGQLSVTSDIEGSGVRAAGLAGLSLANINATAGNVDLLTSGNLVAKDVRATGNILFEASNTGTATFDSLVSSGGFVAVNGSIPGSLKVNGLTQGTSVILFSIGEMTVGDVTATTGFASLNAQGGALTAGNVDAATSAFLRGTSIFAGDVTARSGLAQLQSAGAITTTSITSLAGGIDVDSTAGGTLNLGVLDASGDIALDTTGNIITTAITAGGNLTVGQTFKANGVNFNGPVSAASITVDATGGFGAGTLTATSGDIDIDALRITAGNISANTGNIVLAASEFITTGTLRANPLSANAGTISVTSTGGGTLTLGDMTAGSNIALNTTGNIIGTNALSNGGTLTIGGTLVPAIVNFSGDLQATAVTVDGLGGFSARNITATTGVVDIDASNIVAGNIAANAGNILLVAANNITTGTVRANPFSANAGTIGIRSTGGGLLSLGDLAAGSTITLDTTGGILGAGAITNGALIIGGTLVPGTVTFSGNLEGFSVTVDALGAFRAGNITARIGAVDIDALSIVAGDVLASNGNVQLVAAGDITTGTVRANPFSATSGIIRIVSSAGGTLTLGDLAAGVGISLDTAGNILGAGAFSGGGSVVIGGAIAPNNVTFTGTLVGESVIVDALGAFRSGNITARTGNIDIDANTIVTGDLLAQVGNVRLESFGNITTGTIRANSFGNTSGTITIRSKAGGALNLGDLAAGLDIALDTTGSITGVGAASGGGQIRIGGTLVPSTVAFTGNLEAESVIVDALGAFSAGEILARSGDIDIDANSIQTGNLRAQLGNVQLVAVGNITTGAITANPFNLAAGTISARSTGGGTINVGELTAGFDINLDTTGSVLGTAALSAGGALVIGGTLNPGAVTFTGDLEAQSVRVVATGAFSAGNVTGRAGNVDITARSIDADILRATRGNVILTAGEAIDTGDIFATAVGGVGGSIDILTNGAFAVSLGNLTASGDVFLDGDLTISTGTVDAGGGLFVGNASATTDVTFGGDVTAKEVSVTIGGKLDAANISSTDGNVFVGAGSIDADDITATGGNLALFAVNEITTGALRATTVNGLGGGILVASTAGGKLTIASATGDADVFLDTAGDIEAGDVTAVDGGVFVGQLITPAAGTQTKLGNVSGKGVTITTIGALEAVTVTATDGDVGINSGSITTGDITANLGGATLVATDFVRTGAIEVRDAISASSTNGGELRLASLDAGGNISLDTTGAVRVIGTTTSTGGALLVGTNALASSVTFGGDVSAASMDVRSSGEVLAGERDGQGNLGRRTNLTSTAGSTIINGGSITTGVIGATGGNVGLTAVGAINTFAITSTGMITATSTGTGVNAGDVRLGVLQAAGNITLNGNAAITTTGTVTSSGGALEVGFVNGVIASAPTSVTFDGNASARSINVRSVGAVQTQNLTSTAGNTTVDARTITTGDITATGGNIGLTALRNITTNALTANGTGTITVTSTGTGADVGNLSLGTMLAGGNITLNGNGVITARGTTTSRSGALEVGFVNGVIASAPTSVTFDGNASARSINVRSVGAVQTQNLTSTAGNTTIDARTITTGDITATGGNIGLTALRNITTNALTANGTGTITVTSTGTGADVGNLSLGTMLAGGNITLNGNGVITARGTTTSSGGALEVGFVNGVIASAPTSVTFEGDASARSINVRSVGAVQTQNLTSTAGNTTIDARTITTGDITATGGNIGLTALRNITTNALTANGTGTITVTSTGTGADVGNLSLGTMLAGGNIRLNGNGAITARGTTTS
ncbi:MAG: filamentous hemagglutinin N-terminal domain-containing protein, partial [Porphyrobacter sp.]|nr:filamentous hemagglutinin N-terminal domain-containing protein [Porphyrobacter sp.]